MKKNKFIYSEEQDAFIVNTLLEDFERRRKERKTYELMWELNINYMLGNQYSCISPRGEIETFEKNYYWETREVYNHIAPIIEMRLARLAKVRPIPSVRPNGNEQSDHYCAKLAKSILTNVFNKLSVADVISRACIWSEITGTCFYKVCWNSELGKTIAVADNKEIKAGDVDISLCSPYEIYPDSCANANIEDCESIIHARAYPANYVNQTYGINVEGADIDSLAFDEFAYNSGIAGRSNVTKLAHVTKHDHVLVIERYEKPSQNEPNGRLTIVAGDVLVYDGELPYIVDINQKRGYPFIKQVSNMQIGCFWGNSVVERLIPVQRTYNALKNRKHEFIARLSAGVLAVEDGSVDIDNLEEEGLAPGKVLVYRSGSEKPQFMDAGSVPSEIADEEDKLLTEFNILGGVSEIMRDSTLPAAVSSGSAITLLIEQDETRLSVTAENIRQAVKQIGEKIIRLYKQFATTKRLSQMTDENGDLEVYYWTGADLSSDDVVLDTVNELTQSAAQRQNVLLELYSKGLLNDENGKLPARMKTKILDSLGFASWETVHDISLLHTKKAAKENLSIKELEPPLEVDDHNLHIEEHTRFLISSEVNKFDEEHKNKILNHIKEHKKLQNTQ